jgi:hypothetical protein
MATPGSPAPAREVQKGHRRTCADFGPARRVRHLVHTGRASAAGDDRNRALRRDSAGRAVGDMRTRIPCLARFDAAVIRTFAGSSMGPGGTRTCDLGIKSWLTSCDTLRQSETCCKTRESWLHRTEAKRWAETSAYAHPYAHLMSRAIQAVPTTAEQEAGRDATDGDVVTPVIPKLSDARGSPRPGRSP